MTNREKLWKAIEAYRGSGGREEHWRNRDALDILIESVVSEEVDWSTSETMSLEIWKNGLHSLQECLQMADGAVAYERKVNANLRSQLAHRQEPIGTVLQKKGYPEGHCFVIWTKSIKPGDKLYAEPA